MAGNPDNAAVWGQADVLIAPIGTALPVGNAAFGVAWEHVGLLDGGQGFEESIEQDSTDHNAWGYGVIATTYGNTKVTKTFTALEENSTVMGLVYDTSGMTFDDEAGTYVGDLKVRDNTSRVLVAFVTTSGDTERRMNVLREMHQAQVFRLLAQGLSALDAGAAVSREVVARWFELALLDAAAALEHLVVVLDPPASRVPPQRLERLQASVGEELTRAGR